MTTIRVSCPGCGTVELTPEEIQLTVVRTPVLAVGPTSHYAFECPRCSRVVEKPADERVAELLTTGGVPTAVVAMRPGHPERPPAGPSLDVNDLLDLVLLLERDDWFGQLLRTGSQR